ncbi:MAG: hypothetical protein AAF317_19590 [Pseudomonadota bacterium]
MAASIEEGAIVTEMSEEDKLAWAEAMAHLPALYLERGGPQAQEVLGGYMEGVRAAGQTPLVDWDLQD